MKSLAAGTMTDRDIYYLRRQVLINLIITYLNMTRGFLNERKYDEATHAWRVVRLLLPEERSEHHLLRGHPRFPGLVRACGNTEKDLLIKSPYSMFMFGIGMNNTLPSGVSD